MGVYMTSLLQKYRQIILYLIFGIATTIVNYLVYYIFREQMAVNYLWSNFWAWFFAVLFAFLTNKKLVFQSKTATTTAYFKEMALFYWYRILSLFLDMGLMYIMISWASFSEWTAKTITQVVVIVLNYVFSKLFIFKNSSKEKNIL